MNSESPTEYRRLIAVFDNTPKDGCSGEKVKRGCIDPEPYLVDYVELSFRINDQKLEDEVQEVCSNYIMLSFVTMYSFIFPSISVFVLGYNACTMRCYRQMHLYYFVRQPLITQNGLGTWMNVIEWLNQATIMFNCLFIFWFGYQFAK